MLRRQEREPHAWLVPGTARPTPDSRCCRIPLWRSPSSLPFAAWLGDEMIGGASLFLHGETAHLFGASTLPRFRGIGAQSALIAARAQAAREAGARWLVGETGKPDAGDKKKDPNAKKEDVQLAAALNHLKGLPAVNTAAAVAKP